MKKIAVVTATRAEYGLLTPLIKRISDDNELELDLIATGTHLSEKHGYTRDEIIKDGFCISHEIPILDKDNDSCGISITTAKALTGFSKCFRDDRPDMVVILGDRTEMLGVAFAALNERILISHIHGGEITEGAIDDCIRHAITKMSYLHFTATELYRKRVIQMGEAPERVFNVGALGVENILTQELLSEQEVRSDIGIPNNGVYAVVTFHPVTMEDNTVEVQVNELCKAMECRPDVFFLITGANADVGGNIVNEIIEDFADRYNNVGFVHSLGMKRYLSAMKYASFVMGNSSSGIIEAPALGTPTINIGDRQKGRLMAETVLCCEPICDAIVDAMEKAANFVHKSSRIFGDGHTSEKMIYHIKNVLMNEVSLKKPFFDIPDRI